MNSRQILYQDFLNNFWYREIDIGESGCFISLARGCRPSPDHTWSKLLNKSSLVTDLLYRGERLAALQKLAHVPKCLCIVVPEIPNHLQNELEATCLIRRSSAYFFIASINSSSVYRLYLLIV